MYKPPLSNNRRQKLISQKLKLNNFTIKANILQQIKTKIFAKDQSNMTIIFSNFWFTPSTVSAI